MKQTLPIARKRSQRDYTLGFKLSVIERLATGLIKPPTYFRTGHYTKYIGLA